jgi:hypothetical protein
MLNLNYNIILTSKQEFKGPNQYQIRPDPYSGSIVLALPGNLFINGQGKSQFGQINAFDDISAYVRGTGVASGSNVEIILSASLEPTASAYWATSSYVKFDSNQDRYLTSVYMAGVNSLVANATWSKGEGANFTGSKSWCVELYAGYAQTGSTFITASEGIPITDYNPKRTVLYKYSPAQAASSSYLWNGIYGYDADPGIGVNLISGSSVFYYTNNQPLEFEVTGTSSFQIGGYTWHHYAVSYENTTRTVRLFIDGEMQQTRTLSPIYDFNFTPNELVQIAGAVDADWNYGNYSGSQFVMQDFRMYNGSNKNYTASFTPPPSMVTWG